MSTPSKDTNEEPKKPSFWEKLSERSASNEDSSLVSAIVRHAEKEAGGEKEKSPKDENSEKKKARSLIANSKTLLTVTIVVAAGIWIYFLAMLHESNYLHEKFDKENITTELNRKTTLFQQSQTDIRDLKKFNKALQIEDLANRIIALDLESPILNYERPTGERVIPREGSTNVLLKTTNDQGEIVYLSEAEILNLEKAKSAQIDTARKALERIIAQSESLQGTINTNAAIEDQLDILIAEIITIDPNEKIFPSAVLKSHFAAAQSAANSILKNVKSTNLENLVSDIKKQISLIDVSGLDQPTSETVTSIKAILVKLSPRQASSFETALREVRALDISKISDNDVYQKVIQIIGDPRTSNNDSDLATAAVIMNNLGRVNTINELRANRVAWSNVIERIEKVVRLGSDLSRDTEGTPTNATRDIDPNNTLVTLTSYTGKSSKDTIELRGEATGQENYQARTFTLVADIIDALEGSKYFKGVDGFAFSRDEDRQGNVSSPISLHLLLQDPAATDERDTPMSTKTTGMTDESQSIDASEAINAEELQDLEFNFSDSGKEAAGENKEEPIEIFEALDTTLNNYEALDTTLNN